MREVQTKPERICRGTASHVLDCTLRDGGYYNNWDFSPDLVQRYLNAITQSDVEIVEIGFRSNTADSYMGACFYTTDDFLECLDIPDHLEVAVMVNGADLFKHPWGPVGAINDLFAPAAQSPVDWVRIAAHPSEAVNLDAGIQRLHELGYRVALNIMQISRLSSDQVQRTVAQIANNEAPDILYFADSLGNMTPAEVRRIIGDIRTAWKGALGIHTHDNMGLALANSIEAMNCGCVWMDGTVYGMGRGAGNASTEDILLQLAQKQPQRFHPTSLFELIRNDFEPLMKKHNWGSNMYYAYAASHEIHPTYVQQMLSTDSYQTDDMMTALKSLSRDDARSNYSSDSLHFAVQSTYVDWTGSWSASSWVKGRPVLLIANGESAKQHQDALLRLIDKWQPLVLSMNYVSWLEPEIVDAYAFSYPTRLATFIDHMTLLGAPIITPLAGLPDSSQKMLKAHSVFDFGLCIDDGPAGIYDTGCRLQEPMVAGYTIAMAMAGGASEIMLAGFDGHGGDVVKIARVNRCLEQLRVCAPEMNILSLTPCPYNVQNDSLYSPRWSQSGSTYARKNHEAFNRHPRQVSI